MIYSLSSSENDIRHHLFVMRSEFIYYPVIYDKSLFKNFNQKSHQKKINLPFNNNYLKKKKTLLRATPPIIKLHQIFHTHSTQSTHNRFGNKIKIHPQHKFWPDVCLYTREY